MTPASRVKLGVGLLAVGFGIAMYARLSTPVRKPATPASEPPSTASSPLRIDNYRPPIGAYAAQRSPIRTRGDAPKADLTTQIDLEGEAILTGLVADLSPPVEICNKNPEQLDAVISISMDDVLSHPENQFHCAPVGISDSRIYLAPRWCLLFDRADNRWASDCRPFRGRF